MTAHMHQIFILSPANSGGARAALLFNPRARFELAQRLQRGEKAPLGEIFSFLSGLYFRGKLVSENQNYNPIELDRTEIEFIYPAWEVKRRLRR